MTQKVFVTSLFVLLLSTVESKKSMMKEVHSLVKEIKDAVSQEGTGPVLPPWPCVYKNIDCRNENNDNVIGSALILPPFPYPNVLEQKCNDFCHTFGDCEFWTLDKTTFPIRCYALKSCAYIESVGFVSGPKNCIYPTYGGGCPFCPWKAPICHGYCSETDYKCLGKCVPQSISNEVCTDLQAKALYGDCANSCYDHSDDCKECVAEKTSAYNCGGKYADCDAFDLGICALAVGKAYLECKDAGSKLEIVKCIAEKVSTNSACKSCLCAAVCKASQDLCDICSTLTKENNFVDVLPKILIQADSGLGFPVTVTTISYQDSPVCPSANPNEILDPNKCAPAITRGNCLVTSIQAVKTDSPDTPCTPFVSNEGSNESRFVVEEDGTTGCKVVQVNNSC